MTTTTLNTGALAWMNAKSTAAGELNLDQIPLAVLVLDATGAAAETNTHWTLLTGLRRERSLRRGWLDAVHHDDRERLALELQSRSGEPMSVDCRIRDDHRWKWTRWWGQAGSRPDDLLVVAIVDIDDDRTRELELDRRASIDPLTGLANRSQVVRHIRRSVGRLGRRDERVGILFVDLNHFKEINDAAGHQAGDHVLACVGERLHHCMRPGDIVGRVGGDEFVVVCSGLQDAAEAQMVGRRVADALAKPFEAAGRSWTLSAAVGVATTASPNADAESLVAQADTAMYEAKREQNQTVTSCRSTRRSPLGRRGRDTYADRATREDAPVAEHEVHPALADALIQRIFTVGLTLSASDSPAESDEATTAVGRIANATKMLDSLIRDLSIAAYQQPRPNPVTRPSEPQRGGQAGTRSPSRPAPGGP